MMRCIPRSFPRASQFSRRVPNRISACKEDRGTWTAAVRSVGACRQCRVLNRGITSQARRTTFAAARMLARRRKFDQSFPFAATLSEKRTGSRCVQREKFRHGWTREREREWRRVHSSFSQRETRSPSAIIVPSCKITISSLWHQLTANCKLFSTRQSIFAVSLDKLGSSRTDWSNLSNFSLSLSLFLSFSNSIIKRMDKSASKGQFSR